MANDAIYDAVKQALINDGQKILVEVKSFSGRSFIRELQQAMGQYRMYVDTVELTKLDYQVHLAVSQDTYADFLSEAEIAQVIQRNQIRLIVVNLEQERIMQWIS